jgi:acyl carrier protein
MRYKIAEIMKNVFEIDNTIEQVHYVKDQIATWDSINHMNLIVALEEEFKVRFSENEINELLSLDLIELTIKEKGI